MLSKISTKDTIHNKYHQDEFKDNTSKSTSEQRIQCRLKSVSDNVSNIMKYPKMGNLTWCHLISSGFQPINGGKTARCKECGLEVSHWTEDMKPFQVHAESRPDCPFVCEMKGCLPKSTTTYSATTLTTSQNASTSNEQEKPTKRQKIETTNPESVSNSLQEAAALDQARRRGFSHWSHRTIPSSAQMIEAGFFNCNVGDRVICIYCNLICQQWTPHTDDPCEVHKTLSPNCIYVKSRLMRPSASIIIVNESTTDRAAGSRSSTLSSLGPLRSNDFVFTASCNPAFSELPRRHQSFSNWPSENLPSVDSLVRAGFFYTGTKSIVTCFYCNGSLQNWGANDDPMIEHARWFPHCAYARQLCGDDLYRKIQESKRAQQELAKVMGNRDATATSNSSATTSTPTNRQLLKTDESTLSRLVAARLDLPISQRLLDQDFKLSIIKRCWEDQLRIKNDDFVSDCDLYVACLILQKQIEHIDGKKENIVIPSSKMKQIREQNKAQMRRETASMTATNNAASSNSTDVDMTSTQSTSGSELSQSAGDTATKPTPIIEQQDAKVTKQTTSTNVQNQSSDSTSSNLCVLCLTEEKRLACIPCGHLATCVACGHSLRSCPICRREIEAFVRIYL